MACSVALLRATNASRCAGNKQDPTDGNPLTAGMTQPEFIVVQSVDCPNQICLLLLGRSKGCLVDAPVVDGVHSAHSANGIFGRDGFG